MSGNAAWHVRAVLRIDPENADTVLLDLLSEPDYEQAVASELVRRLEAPKSDQDPVRKADYRQVWKARSEKIAQPYSERRKRYGHRVREHLAQSRRYSLAWSGTHTGLVG
jgi:hypothetical protein